MRLKVIASSSKGNCYIIGNKEEILILECGVTFAAIKKGIDMKEIWKDVKGFEGIYSISNYGRLKSFKVNPEGYVLKNTNTKGDYLTIVLQAKGKRRRSTRIHRLVAEHFIPNPMKLREVNHIDSNKQNNKEDNLEWVTRKQNVRHAIEHNPNIIKGINDYNQNKISAVQQQTLSGYPIASYDSVMEASEVTGVCKRNIYQVASKTEYKPGKTRSQAGGYKWKYITI